MFAPLTKMSTLTITTFFIWIFAILVIYDIKNIEALRIEDLKIESCKGGWDDQLAHQLDKLPSFEEYFNKFKFIHHHMSLYNLKE